MLFLRPHQFVLSDMKFTCVFFALLFSATFANSSDAAAPWVFHKSSPNLEADGVLSFEGDESQVRIDFVCFRSDGPNVHDGPGLELMIHHPEEIKHFNFRDFEDSASKAIPLMKIVTSPGRDYLVKPAGRYSDLGFGFVFGETKSGRVIKSIVRDIQKGARRLDIEITDSRKPDKKLQVGFDVAAGQRWRFSRLVCE